MADLFVTVGAAGGGAGTEGDPYTLAESTANASPGDNVFVKAGTYTADDSSSSSIMDIDVAGTSSGWIRWIGYTTTIADFTLGDAQPVILDANTNSLTNAVQTSTISGTVKNSWRGFRFTGASSDGVSFGTASDYGAFEGCKFDTNGDRGFQGDNITIMVACEFTGNTTSAVDVDSQARFIWCKFHNEASSVVITSTDPLYVGCVFYNNGNGFSIAHPNNGEGIFIGNTFDGDNQAASVAISTTGVNGQFAVMYNNVFFDFNIAVDFTSTSTDIFSRGYNLFNSNGTDYDTLALHVSDIAGGSDPFTNSGTRDYSPKTSSELIDAGIDGGTV